MYADAGNLTCGFHPGSLGHETADAASFAEWGVDYLKYDNCKPYSLLVVDIQKGSSKPITCNGLCKKTHQKSHQLKFCIARPLDPKSYRAIRIPFPLVTFEMAIGGHMEQLCRKISIQTS